MAERSESIPVSCSRDGEAETESTKAGIIALMGSGELTATMVAVHKELLSRLPKPAQAVFLDTPAGFQLNVDQLSQRAVEYFDRHVGQSMAPASYKGSGFSDPYETERALRLLRGAHFILMGPGSPTYALRQWRSSPVPEILKDRIARGNCLAAASAAALTVGCLTLPVYEIYKVGDDLHWVEGMDILGSFGFRVVVVPHWNNAEGGTHDTRFCYMGESRFRHLERLLPDDVLILGLDEHTACILDIERGQGTVRGIGGVTLRFQGHEKTFSKGECFPLDLLRGTGAEFPGHSFAGVEPPAEPSTASRGGSLWDVVHAMEAAFRRDLQRGNAKGATQALLELDRVIWQAHRDLESDEFIAQAREIFRELVVLMGVRLASATEDEAARLAKVVEEMLALRDTFRQNRQWAEADAVREGLRKARVVVEDTRYGVRWRFSTQGSGGGSAVASDPAGEGRG